MAPSILLQRSQRAAVALLGGAGAFTLVSSSTSGRSGMRVYAEEKQQQQSQGKEAAAAAEKETGNSTGGDAAERQRRKAKVRTASRTPDFF